MAILIEENKLCSQKVRGYSQNATAREVTVTSHTGTQNELNKRVVFWKAPVVSFSAYAISQMQAN